MIDLHSHILPGVDDGPDSLDEAKAMCRLAYETGCRLLVATPHRRRDEWADRPRAELRERLAELAGALDVPLELALGSELRVDSELVRELAASEPDELPTLGDSRALLLEFEPRGIGPEPLAIVAELVERGFRPVVAHPELTPCLHGQTALVGELRAAGAAVQVTAMSLTGEFGRPARIAVHALVEAGFVDAVASDAHRLEWRPPILARARTEVVRNWGEEVAAALFETNARSLLAPTASGGFAREAFA